MIRLNTMPVPITETPIRTGSASADRIGVARMAASGFGGMSDGSGSIRVPILVPGAVAKP
jgi:hypothetical protein